MAINEEISGRSQSVSADEQRLLTTGSIFATNDDSLSQITQANGFSKFTNPLTSTLYGLDIFGASSPAPQVHEQYGLTFFTRPMLNLSYDNIKADRTLTPMLTLETTSAASYIRSILDPVGGHVCPLVDPQNAFIPLLSSTLTTLTGWQDPIVDTYTSPTGLKKEQWAMVDSSNKVFRTYELSASFRNTRGNILGYFFHVWQTYMSGVYEGILLPRAEMIRHNTIDYQTRVYRLILDPTRTFVEDIICCFAAFPLTNPIGARANYNQAEPVNKDIDLVNISFMAVGARYYDPITIYEFNKASGILNPNFQDDAKRMTSYRRLYPSEYKLFTYRAYPRIHPTSARLEWWVSNETHLEVMGNVDYGGYNPDGDTGVMR